MRIIKWGHHPTLRTMSDIIPFYRDDIGTVTSMIAFLLQSEIASTQPVVEYGEAMLKGLRIRSLMKMGHYAGHIFQGTGDNQIESGDFHLVMKVYLERVFTKIPDYGSLGIHAYKRSDVIEACVDELAAFLFHITTFSTLSQIGASSVLGYERIQLYPALEIEPILQDFLAGCRFQVQFTRFPAILQRFSFPVGSFDNPPIKHIEFVAN